MAPEGKGAAGNGSQPQRRATSLAYSPAPKMTHTSAENSAGADGGAMRKFSLAPYWIV
jgi:hypothetical protein